MSSTISEHQAWTAAGSDATAQKTYASIKTALADLERRRSIEIFLQGSYANATNIRADSDVDIVVMARDIFAGSTERLSPQKRAAYDNLATATRSPQDLKQEVVDELRKYYGAARVRRRNKCIRVDAVTGYVDADVVPSLEYRWYRRPDADLDRDFVQGVKIYPDNGSSIVNFPKEHLANGRVKNASCSQRYKPTVRQIKRLRNRAQDMGLVREGVAPGYLLECLVYNVPNEKFVAGDSERLQDVLLWLKWADKEHFSSCDEIHTLFGTDPGNFNVEAAQQILDSLWIAL